jgi:hypothetical protein
MMKSPSNSLFFSLSSNQKKSGGLAYSLSTTERRCDVFSASVQAAWLRMGEEHLTGFPNNDLDGDFRKCSRLRLILGLTEVYAVSKLSSIDNHFKHFSTACPYFWETE